MLRLSHFLFFHYPILPQFHYPTELTPSTLELMPYVRVQEQVLLATEAAYLYCDLAQAVVACTTLILSYNLQTKLT